MPELVKSNPIGEAIVREGSNETEIRILIAKSGAEFIGRGDFSVVLGMGKDRVFALDWQESLYNPLRPRREFYYSQILSALHPEHFYLIPTSYSPTIREGQFLPGGSLRERISINKGKTDRMVRKLGSNSWYPNQPKPPFGLGRIPFDLFPAEIAEKMYNWMENGIPVTLDPYGENSNIVYEKGNNGRLVVIDPPHSSYPTFSVDWDFPQMESFMQTKDLPKAAIERIILLGKRAKHLEFLEAAVDVFARTYAKKEDSDIQAALDSNVLNNYLLRLRPPQNREGITFTEMDHPFAWQAVYIERFYKQMGQAK